MSQMPNIFYFGNFISIEVKFCKFWTGLQILYFLKKKKKKKDAQNEMKIVFRYGVRVHASI